MLRRTRVDRFCDILRDRLIGIEGLVSDLRVRIDDDREATKAAIDKAITDARTALRRVKDDAEAARVRMKAYLAEGKGESADLVAERIRNRDLDELERRAEDAEANAAWAVIVATEAINEADLAAMQAIAARLDVEIAAAGCAGTARTNEYSGDGYSGPTANADG